MELNSAVLTIVHCTEASNSGFYQDKDYKVIKLFYSFKIMGTSVTLWTGKQDGE